jgi:aspartate-semialdehyde dehydrogenase
MTSLQAVSGAGRSPGVVALDIADNVVPFIAKEEEKVEAETRKILGSLVGESIEPATIAVSCTCTRVAVLEGHTEAVTASLRSPASVEQIKEAMRSFGEELRRSPTHPSAPEQWITIHDDPYRPQPRRDRDNDRGMTTTVGRIREDRVLGPQGVRFVLVSHNTKMGAAMGAVLVAEDLRKRGHLG